MKIKSLTSTWPLLSWGNPPTSATPGEFTFDVTVHIQAIVNDDQR